MARAPILNGRLPSTKAASRGDLCSGVYVRQAEALVLKEVGGDVPGRGGGGTETSPCSADQAKECMSPVSSTGLRRLSILWLGRKCPRWRHPLGLVFCPLNEIHLGRARSACGGVQPTPCLLSRLLPAAAFSVGPRLGAVPGTPPQSALGPRCLGQ